MLVVGRGASRHSRLRGHGHGQLGAPSARLTPATETIHFHQIISGLEKFKYIKKSTLVFPIHRNILQFKHLTEKKCCE